MTATGADVTAALDDVTAAGALLLSATVTRTRDIFASIFKTLCFQCRCIK